MSSLQRKFQRQLDRRNGNSTLSTQKGTYNKRIISEVSIVERGMKRLKLLHATKGYRTYRDTSA